MSESKHITIRLTHKQAEALLHALGNSTGHPDVMQALFEDGRERRAAREAEAKIQHALYAA